MIAQHNDLTQQRWDQLTLFEQMANVGSEIERSIKWKKAGSQENFRISFERGLELLDLTIADPKNIRRLKELLRVREALADYFMFKNEYRSTDKLWQNYFYAFNYAARLNR